ncbi:MAG: sulfate transporter CysZ [Gammaproteobacteria bacterium]
MSVFAPLHGAAYLWRGFRLIGQDGLRRYVIAPLIINTALFGSAIWYGADKFESFIDGLLPSWLDWLQWLLWPLFAVTVLVASFYTFTIVANFISSPFNGLLAAQVERRLAAGQALAPQAEFSVLESFQHEVKKILFLLGWAIPLAVLFLIPGLNLLAPFAWLIFSTWMLVLEYCDYPMGNHGIPFHDQRRLLRGRPFLNLGFGAATLLATSIPVVNFFALPAAVAGATALWAENLREPRAANNPTGAKDR